MATSMEDLEELVALARKGHRHASVTAEALAGFGTSLCECRESRRSIDAAGVNMKGLEACGAIEGQRSAGMPNSL